MGERAAMLLAKAQEFDDRAKSFSVRAHGPRALSGGDQAIFRRSISIVARTAAWATSRWKSVSASDTDRSVSSLTRAGTIATAIATGHGFTVGQFVYIFGADQRAYNGRHVVTTVPNADTFTYKVGGRPPTPATGTIVALQAATLLTAVRFYNSEIPLPDDPKVVRSQLSSKNFIERVFFKFDRTSPRRRADRLGPDLDEGAGQERPPPADECSDPGLHRLGHRLPGGPAAGLRVRPLHHPGSRLGPVRHQRRAADVGRYTAPSDSSSATARSWRIKSPTSTIAATMVTRSSLTASTARALVDSSTCQTTIRTCRRSTL